MVEDCAPEEGSLLRVCLLYKEGTWDKVLPVHAVRHHSISFAPMRLPTFARFSGTTACAWVSPVHGLRMVHG